MLIAVAGALAVVLAVSLGTVYSMTSSSGDKTDKSDSGRAGAAAGLVAGAGGGPAGPGSAASASAAPGSCSLGSGGLGSGSPGLGSLGPGSPGSGNLGSGDLGSCNPGSGTPGGSASASPGSAASAPSEPAAGATGCARPSAAKPAVRITDVKLPVKPVGYGGEGDTDKLPMAIAARPDGGSWLAWLGTDGRVHLARLGCDDKVIGKPVSFTGIDLQDVHADRTGGVLLLTRKGTCGSGPLCGGESSPCNTMHMIRFDNAGGQVWERQVTNLTGGRQGYDDGARFVWWYQHHGRLATDGTNYAAYFGVAITVRNGNCVDIHQGDRMQVVNARGALVKSAGFEVGCSHAWTSRIAWDPRTKKFVTACATDNSCRIAQPSPYRTIAAGTCDGTLFGGDLVAAEGKGHWLAWSQGGQVRLERFTTGKSTTTVRTGIGSAHPHLAAYGAGRMLLTWQSGGGTAGQVFDAGSGRTVGGRLTIGAKDHNYQALKAYADGSAAFPAAGGSGARIARVLPMTG